MYKNEFQFELDERNRKEQLKYLEDESLRAAIRRGDLPKTFDPNYEDKVKYREESVKNLLKIDRQKKLDRLRKWEGLDPDSPVGRLAAMIEDRDKGTDGKSLNDPLWR